MYVIGKFSESGCQAGPGIGSGSMLFSALQFYNGILLPKLFWPIVWKKLSSDWEKLEKKFKAEGREFGIFLRSLEQFIQTVKGQNNFW